MNKVFEALFRCVQNKLVIFCTLKLKFQREVGSGRDDSTTFQCKARNQLFVLDSSKKHFHVLSNYILAVRSKTGRELKNIGFNYQIILKTTKKRSIPNLFRLKNL